MAATGAALELWRLYASGCWPVRLTRDPPINRFESELTGTEHPGQQDTAQTLSTSTVATRLTEGGTTKRGTFASPSRAAPLLEASIHERGKLGPAEIWQHQLAAAARSAQAPSAAR